MPSGKGRVVCVTGASGYIAGELISQLLAKKFRVKGTVRELKNSSKIDHLKEISAGAKPPLELFEADLLKEGSFAEAFKDVEVVFHLACPKIATAEDPQRDLVDPAVKGTENVLKEAEKAGVKRVIVVSDVVTLIGSKKKKTEYVYGERDANTTCSLTDAPYEYAKLMQEKVTWEFSKSVGDKMRIITVLPGTVLGPTRSPRVDSSSVQFMRNILKGEYSKDGVPALAFPITDVRDLATALIHCVQNAYASGRYVCCSKQSYTTSQIVKALQQKFSQYNLPTGVNGEFPATTRWDNSRTEKELWIVWRQLSETITDMARSLIEQGIVERIYKRVGSVRQKDDSSTKVPEGTSNVHHIAAASSSQHTAAPAPAQPPEQPTPSQPIQEPTQPPKQSPPEQPAPEQPAPEQPAPERIVVEQQASQPEQSPQIPSNFVPPPPETPAPTQPAAEQPAQ